MTNHDTNGHTFDHLLAKTKHERNRKYGRAGRDSIQTFYSSNEDPERHDDDDDDGNHSPGISHEEAAWSPLSQTMAGPLEGPFSSFSEVCPAAEPQPSSCLDEPFSMPARREYPTKPQASGRLDTPFDEYAEMHFASTDASSPYNNANTTRSGKGKKYRPESSTSLNSQITREIKYLHGHELAPALQSPIDPDHGDVPLPLNTGGKHSTRSRLTKKNNLGSNMNPPSHLGPRLRLAPQPRPVPPPCQVPQSRLVPPQKHECRRYLSKKPPPLSLSNSSHKFSGSGSGHGAAGPDTSTLSGEIPFVNRPRRLEKKKSSFHQGGSKGYGKSTDDKAPIQRPKQQQQHLRRTGDSPVSPVSYESLGSSVSPISPLSPIDKPRDLAQQKRKPPVVCSQRRDNPDQGVKVAKPYKLQSKQRVSLAGDTKAEPGHLTARFEFDLEIPVVTRDSETEGECDPAMSENRKGKRLVRFKKTDITPIEECPTIRGFVIRAADKNGLLNFDLKYTEPCCCYRMDDAGTAKTTKSNDEPNDSGYTRTVRYYAFVRDLAIPPNMAECKLIATFWVDYSPETTFQVTLKEWLVDVSRFQSVRQQ